MLSRSDQIKVERHPSVLVFWSLVGSGILCWCPLGGVDKVGTEKLLSTYPVRTIGIQNNEDRHASFLTDAKVCSVDCLSLPVPLSPK